MATHDYVLDNATGATFRADLNNNLQAILSNNSSSSAPSSTAAGMLWADTTNNLLMVRDSGNANWYTVGSLNSTGGNTVLTGDIGATVQAYDADLDTVATNGIGTGANQIVQTNASSKIADSLLDGKLVHQATVQIDDPASSVTTTSTSYQTATTYTIVPTTTNTKCFVTGVAEYRAEVQGSEGNMGNTSYWAYKNSAGVNTSVSISTSSPLITSGGDVTILDFATPYTFQLDSSMQNASGQWEITLFFNSTYGGTSYYYYSTITYFEINE
jgi:hypothetical protein